MGKKGRRGIEELYATEIERKIRNIDVILAGSAVSDSRRAHHELVRVDLEAELSRRKAGGRSIDEEM